MASSHFSGDIKETGTVNSQQTARTSVRGFSQFIPVSMSGTGVGGNVFKVNGTATMTRIAQYQYAIRRTAAAANHNPFVEFLINSLGVFTDAASASINEKSRSIRITSVDTIYGLTVEAADAIVPSFNLITYAQGGAVASVAAQAGSVTTAFGLTSGATLNIGTFTFTTAIIPTSLQQLIMDLRVDDSTGGNAVFDLYGVRVNGDILL